MTKVPVKYLTPAEYAGLCIPERAVSESIITRAESKLTKGGNTRMSILRVSDNYWDYKTYLEIDGVSYLFAWDSTIIAKYIIDTEMVDQTISELCPHCNSEVEIQATFKAQRCPTCGKTILPCSICEQSECSACLLKLTK